MSAHLENRFLQSLPAAAPIPKAAPLPKAAQPPTLPFQSRKSSTKILPEEPLPVSQKEYANPFTQTLSPPPAEEPIRNVETTSSSTVPLDLPNNIPPVLKKILQQQIPHPASEETEEKTSPPISPIARIISWLIWGFVLFQIFQFCRAFFHGN